jgi:hypothetical protein
MKKLSGLFFLHFAFLLVFLTCNTWPAFSESPEDSRSLADHPELTKEAAQTIASLFSITLRDLFIASRWNLPGSANIAEVRTVVPFKIWEQNNLMRFSIPFQTHSEAGPGLTDIRIFDLIMFGQSKTIWGIGPVFNFGPNRGPNVDTFQAGPVAAFVFAPTKALSVGLLNQNLFSGQVALSTLQPIFVFQFAENWTIGLGELPLVYNWKSNSFAVVSIGLQLGFITRPGNQPIRIFLNPQYNTTSNTKLYQWTIASGITFLLSPLP